MKQIKRPTFKPTTYNKLQALKIIADQLKKENVPFTLGGSGLLYFLGILESFNDWDLVLYCSEEKAKETFSKLKLEYPERKLPYTSTYFFRTSFLGTNFDIMGHFGVTSEAESVVIGEKPFKLIDNIPLGNPVEWMHAYKLMGRIEKHDLLYNYLNPSR